MYTIDKQDLMFGLSVIFDIPSKQWRLIDGGDVVTSHREVDSFVAQARKLAMQKVEAALKDELFLHVSALMKHEEPVRQLLASHLWISYEAGRKPWKFHLRRRWDDWEAGPFATRSQLLRAVVPWVAQWYNADVEYQVEEAVVEVAKTFPCETACTCAHYPTHQACDCHQHNDYPMHYHGSIELQCPVA